jgi:hypothetical protein
MKTTIKSVLAAIAATIAVSVFAAPPSSISEFVPKLMNYQGYLANPSTGTAYRDGIYDIECRLYRAQSGGSAIWGAKYSVYVKDGYFNIMLGDSSGATSLTADYGMSYLWKALWYDTALTAANNNQLWLGVTPLQDANHATISSPKEISPRQQLLAAPFAFRAQSAKYADAALGDFSVAGNLTVSGSLSLPSNYSLPYIKAMSSGNGILILGDSSGTPINNGPIVTNAATRYASYSYYDQNFRTRSGSMNFDTPSGNAFRFNTGAFAVTNSNSIGMKSSAVNIKSSGAVNIAGGSYGYLNINGYYTTVKGYYATVTSETTRVEAKNNVYLSPGTNWYVYGQGALRWKSPGISSYLPPFRLRKVTLKFSAGKNNANVLVESAPVYYRWAVVGVRTQVFYQPPLCQIYAKQEDSGAFRVYGELEKAASSETTYYIEVMGVANAFADDQRNSD